VLLVAAMLNLFRARRRFGRRANGFRDGRFAPPRRCA
jgi:hypothetical protein